MLLPIGDENHDRKSFPFVNYLLIGLNILVFVYFQDFGFNIQFTFSYATIFCHFSGIYGAFSS